MGQKVHPLGFRVGITKKHQTQWFARFQKYAYSQSVFEDHMLRKNLVNLFSNFEKENALATKQGSSMGRDSNRSTKSTSNKKTNTSPKMAKITQIKIERGLIPYEIGIQIHSDDCLAITKAIDNVKLSKDLVSNLQKTRKYLFKAGTQLAARTQTTLLPASTSADSSQRDVQRHGLSKKRKLKLKNLLKTNKSKSFAKKKKRLAKTTFMRLKNIKRRFKKRQSIKKRYVNLISKGLLIRKKGTLIIRNVKVKRKNKVQPSLKTKFTKAAKVTSQSRFAGSPKSTKTKKQAFIGRIYKKFLNLFLTKLNKQFLIRLKAIMKFWHNEGQLSQAPLGTSVRWYASKAYSLINTLKTSNLQVRSSAQIYYQTEKLTKLISLLEKKSLVKMEKLRKDFITFGTLSKTRAFGYYQIITFLKQLKELFVKIKKQKLKTKIGSETDSALTNNAFADSSKNMLNVVKIQNLIKAKAKQKKTITQKLVNNYVNLVSPQGAAMTNEARKIKWISYLKDLVNKHRNENIFYYLATIADARKDLKALKRYTKEHSTFLFGINLETSKDNPTALLQRVTKTLAQSANDNSNDSQTALQKAFLNRISDQRKMYNANLALTPKISIKFFSVKTADVLEKASTVADSIVDALEKRKAFRGVIKKAKEDLMRRPRIKGVKIQVAGRLNGAEIARSEWVRAGRVPLQTLRANIDYSYRTANTIYGIIGIKVWIFKGYSKIN